MAVKQGGPSDFGNWNQFDPFGEGDGSYFSKTASSLGLNDADAQKLFDSMTGEEQTQFRSLRASGQYWEKGSDFLKGLKGYSDIDAKMNPKAPPPPLDLTDETLSQARKAQMQRLLSGQGRASSFLTGPDGAGQSPGLGASFMKGRASTLLGG